MVISPFSLTSMYEPPENIGLLLSVHCNFPCPPSDQTFSTLSPAPIPRPPSLFVTYVNVTPAQAGMTEIAATTRTRNAFRILGSPFQLTVACDFMPIIEVRNQLAKYTLHRMPVNRGPVLKQLGSEILDKRRDQALLGSPPNQMLVRAVSHDAE
jgi:hypothetical protein